MSGFHTRGYLPHLDVPRPQFLTWRLEDAVPVEVIDIWREDLKHQPDAERAKQLNRQIEQFADGGAGSCLLRQPRLARLVQETLFHDHNRRYTLGAWVVMPNHVHVILTPLPGQRLGQIVQALKGVSSKRIGAAINQSGRVWQADYFDRIVRDDDHLDRLRRYIEWNPVKAKLTEDPKIWPWSSANPDAWARLSIVADQGSAHR